MTFFGILLTHRCLLVYKLAWWGHSNNTDWSDCCSDTGWVSGLEREGGGGREGGRGEGEGGGRERGREGGGRGSEMEGGEERERGERERVCVCVREKGREGEKQTDRQR